MNKTKNNPVIPDYILKEDDRKQFREKFDSALRGCNESYKELMGIRDLEIPEDPKTINADDVNRYIDERINDVSAASMLTFDGKERAKKEWEDIRTKAIDHIQKVRRFLEDYPDAVVELVDGSLICTNADTLVFDRCKVKTPENAYKHFELIGKVETAIKELQEFESLNDYPTGELINIEMDIRMSKNPQWLIENWLHQELRRKYAEKHQYMVAVMEMQNRKERAIHQARMKELSQKYEQEHPDDYTIEYNKTRSVNDDNGQGTATFI